MVCVLNAHVLLWHRTASPRLSEAAQMVLDDPAARLVVPTIVLAEPFHLHGRGRTSTSLADAREWIAGRPDMVVYPLDQRVLSRLPADLELHDAIVVAMAPVCRDAGPEPVRVGTADRRNTASGLVDVLW